MRSYTLTLYEQLILWQAVQHFVAHCDASADEQGLSAREAGKTAKKLNDMIAQTNIVTMGGE